MVFLTAASFFYYFIFIPLAFGRILINRLQGVRSDDIAVGYITGFLGFFAIFTVFCLPATIAGIPFHFLTWYIRIASAVIALAFIIFEARKREISLFRERIKSVLSIIIRHWWIIFPAAIILFQICRSVLKMTFLYSDDQAYISSINDMLNLDIILGTDYGTGIINANARLSNPKGLLASWLQFEGVMSVCMHTHPLIFIKSLFPVFMISFHYLIIWVLSRFLFRDYKDYNKRVYFLLFYVLLMEFGSASTNANWSYLLLSWCWYGKSVLQYGIMFAVPLLFLLIRSHQTGWYDGLMIVTYCVAGLGVSTMSLILLPVELIVIIVIESIGKRTVRELWLCLPALVPLGIVASLYYIYF